MSSDGRSRTRSRSRSPIRWSRRRMERPQQERRSCSRDTWRPGRSPVRDRRGRSPPGFSNEPGRSFPYYSGMMVKPDIIPEFDPERPELPASLWRNKVEQLGAIHGWNDNVKSYYMQARLVGLAKLWHDALRSYEFTWAEWKQKILEAFPQSIDYADALREMLNRKKVVSETMTHYFYSKCTMLTKCDIIGEKAVSCIIEGLPFHMRTSARAGNYKTPGELYSHFLCMNDDRRMNQPQSQRNTPRGRDSTSGSLKEATRDQKERKPGVTCFLCNEPGHVVRACPNNPNAIKCEICGKTNHKKEQCYQKAVSVVQIQVNECYFKQVLINGLKGTAYLDTGAQVNLITRDCVLKLGVAMQPCVVFVNGFGGPPIRAHGQVSLEFIIDEVKVCSDAVVVDTSVNRADVFIGQPILNNDKFKLTVCGPTVFLEYAGRAEKKTESIEINSLQIGTCMDKVNILCCIDTVVPAYSSMYVGTYNDVEIGESTELFVDNRTIFYNGYNYSVPASIHCFPVQAVFIINHGEKPVCFQKGQVVARGLVTQEVDCSQNSAGSLASIMSIDTAKIKCGSGDPQVVKELAAILKEYSDCFSVDTGELGRTDKIEVNIELNSDKPVCYRPYRLSFSEKAIVREKVEDMMSNGIIRESSSNYASPIVLVRKKNGDYRFCVDFRKLNSITVKDKYPLPIIEEQIEKLGGKKLFTSLDLSQSFFQIPVAEASIHRTGFVTPEGHYEFLRMPFGLANSPAIFQRLMDKIFSSLRHDKVLPFIDDLLLPTKTEQEGLDLLRIVLKIIRDAKLTLNLEKCFFLQDKIDYLGYEISGNGIRPGSKKIDAVVNYIEPKNVHELRMFLGLTSYFRKFVKDYASVTHDLYGLLKKNAAWIWGPAQQRAFDQLKQILTTRPTLSLFCRKGDIEVHTDASSKGVAGILFQDQDGGMKPIAYFSRKTSKEESMYHSYELETLAVVESLRRFRIYLAGNRFKVVTDCAAVRDTFLKKDLLPRIARWWLSIQEYDMEVVHKPGKSHGHVDALSRFPVDPPLVADINVIDVFDWLVCLQNQDEKIRIIRTKLESGNDDPDIRNNYKLKDGRVYKLVKDGELRLVVPKYGRWNIMRKYHDCMGHPGLKRCEDIIKGNFWFAGMTRFIRKYVNSCLDCLYKRGQYGRPEGELHPIEKVPEPMHTLHIDHLGPFCKSRAGNSFVLMVVDSFTKFTWAVPVKTTKTLEVIKSLNDIFCLFGYPKRIISDSGTSFKSKHFKQFSLDNQIKHIINAVACPRANGQVERYNRTLLDSLNTSVEDEKDWDTRIANITWGMNNLQNGSTGFTPYRLMFSASRSRYQGMGDNIVDNEETAARTRAEATANLNRTAEKMRKYFNVKRKPPTKYKVSDLVLWKGAADRNVNVRRKLKEKYSGPYKVTKVVGNDRYMISSLKGIKGYKRFRALVSSDSLKPFQGEDSSASSNESEVDSTEELIDLLEG